jgi:hypothetical protein
MLLGSCEKSDQSIHETRGDEKEMKIELNPGRIVTVYHPSDVPPVSIWAEQDAIFVEHNLGEDGTANRLSGNTFRVWLKSKESGRVWISRNQSPEARTMGLKDSSLYEDQNGDGIVDYKRNSDGVFRVAEIIWEKIGDIPAVPPDELNQRIDTHRNSLGSRELDQNAEQAGAEQPATRPVVESEGDDKPQPEAEGRSR